MPTALIMTESEIFADLLRRSFPSDWKIHHASDGATAARRIRDLHPDALLLSLDIPGTDGLQLLEDISPTTPPVTLALTTSASECVFQAAAALGVGCILPIPANTEYVAARILEMHTFRSHPQSKASRHLDVLKIRPKLSGYRCLVSAITLFSKEPSLLMKELYPEVAKECGLCNADCVERVIRMAIQDAWGHRAKETWSRYFPSHSHCPTNKAFISILAQKQ